MATHLKVIAVLEIVFGSLAAIGAVFVLFIFTVGSAAINDSEGQGTPEWVAGAAAGMGVLIGGILGIVAVIAIVGGVKLLAHKRSGKILTFVSAALALLNIPFGTAFGIYAIVILTRPETDSLLVDA
jgi:hypothetical protein